MKLSAMRSVTVLIFLLAARCTLGGGGRYRGREVGALSQLHHGVKGVVYAVDARTLYIHDFHYDGVGPAAYFYVGKSGKPSASGATRLRDERGGTSPLRRYRGEGVTLSLPDGITLKDVTWFSVWCDDYAVNFGDVSIPRDLEYPKPAKVGALHGVHGVSSDALVVVDAQTLLVPNFSYDGEAPDAKFWVGRGDTPSPQGIRIPDENGKEAPLRKYDRKTIVLTLPGELTVFDIGHFAVWCEAFTVNFGHVGLPHAALANVPPSLKMLGVSPQSRNSALASKGASRASSRGSRPKIAKVDATTYRPALALAAGPRATPDHRPEAHEHLHRRAYTHSSQQQLVQIQPSQEIPFREHNQEDLYRQYQEQKQKLEELQRQYQQTQQKQQLYIQNQQNDQSRHQQHSESPQIQQQQYQYQYQNSQQGPQQAQDYQQGPQQTQEYQQPYQNQQYYPQEDPALLQRQLYERQLYEQQRIAYERELLQRQAQGDEEPFRYRLLPYSYDGGH